MLKTPLLIFVCLSICHPSFAIEGGENAAFMSAVGYRVQNGSECSGVMLRRGYILTSAHCLTEDGSDDADRFFEVRFEAFVETRDGRSLECLHTEGRVPVSAPDEEPDSPCPDLTTADVFIHPDYDAGQWPNHDDEDDLAILRFSRREVPTLDYALFLRRDPQEGAKLFAYGYSYGGTFLTKSFRDRRRGTFEIEDVDRRDIEFDNTDRFKMCLGDSGGPVAVRFEGPQVVVGLVSEGPIPPGNALCAREGDEMHATRLWPVHGDWIESKIGRQCWPMGPGDALVQCWFTPDDVADQPGGVIDEDGPDPNRPAGTEPR